MVAVGLQVLFLPRCLMFSYEGGGVDVFGGDSGVHIDVSIVGDEKREKSLIVGVVPPVGIDPRTQQTHMQTPPHREGLLNRDQCVACAS